jgi:translation initiation factor 5
MNNPFAQSLNIGGVEDAYYRYKMPKMETHTESKNGGTTIIDNIDGIALKLGRDSKKDLVKYFKKHLSCNVSYDKKKGLVIPAKKEIEELTSILESYINKYVICPICKVPETTIEETKKKTTLMCAACGGTSII